MSDDDREMLEGAAREVAERAARAGALVDEAFEAGLDGSHPAAVQAKLLRLELLEVKAEIERELGRRDFDCGLCGRAVRWEPGLGTSPGCWTHSDQADHDPVAGLR